MKTTSMAVSQSITRGGFGKNFYAANVMEIFERLAWYGFFALASLYMTTPVAQGGVGFSDTERGAILGIVPFFLYILPVFTGALADRYGYRKMFALSFAIMAPGYFLLGSMTSFSGFFMTLMWVALGAACFKPVVVGTISQSTDDTNRSLGFGIFYTMVNIGGFLGPLVAGYIRVISWDAVFMMSALWILINFIPLGLFYRTPKHTIHSQQSLQQVLLAAQQVLGNLRFGVWFFVSIIIVMAMGVEWLHFHHGLLLLVGWSATNVLWSKLMRNRVATVWYCQPIRISNPKFALYLLILTGFWTVYNQLFYTLPLYIRDFVDTSDLVQALALLGPEWVSFFAHVDLSAVEKLLLETVIGDQKWDVPITAQALQTALSHTKLLLPDSDVLSLTQSLKQLVGLSSEQQKDTISVLATSLLQYRQVNPEYLINLDFAAIVLLQVLVSHKVRHFRKITVLVAGLLITTLAFLLLVIASDWLTGGMLIVMTILLIALGEMFTSPKSQEYVATMAPHGQAALFMGYYFVSMALGFLFAGFLSGWSYGYLVKELGKPEYMWGIFAAIALLTALAFRLFAKRVEER
ncbi:MFS transporter [Pseudoalteromonas fenneropenaei]|uniref:MFS transporter n=1 Tax=Pseudoalteromonas fenneropenaei TaxID=1737459 RepID=A0ABV7CFM8_9GAMM